MLAARTVAYLVARRGTERSPRDRRWWLVVPCELALVVFLRSFGCTFCREAMADVHDGEEEAP